MVTKFLKERWLKCGLNKNDKVLLHSSLKRTFNEVKKAGYNITPEDVLESFIDLVLPEGTLVIPTFNFDFNEGKPYDFYSTKSQMGIMTEYARKHPLAKRTLNPVYSFAAFGKKADLFEGLDNESWYSKNSPFGLIHKFNFKICIIDLSDRNSMTFAHYCEEYFQVPWRYYKNFTGEYSDKNGFSQAKTYKGYVRKMEEGIQTTLNPAGELMWKNGIYNGDKPFINSGLRYVQSKDYFNLFEDMFKKKKSIPYYYEIKND